MNEPMRDTEPKAEPTMNMWERWESQVREAITEQWRLEMYFHGCIADPDEAKRDAFFELFEKLTTRELTMLAQLAFLNELDLLIEKGELVEPEPNEEGERVFSLPPK